MTDNPPNNPLASESGDEPGLSSDPADNVLVARLSAQDTVAGDTVAGATLSDTAAVTTGAGASDSASDTPDAPSGSFSRTLVEWSAVIFTALAVALVIKAYVFQAFEIPSGSMQTTLNIGDRILVNKLSYDFGDVERGDLTVFSKLEGTQSDTEELIKRTIGLPGETVEVRADGRIWIWGPGETAEDAVQLPEPYLNSFNERLAAPRAADPVTVAIWDPRCTNAQGDGGRCTLDDSSFFMMGDNRNGSTDSRSFGPVPEENIVGRAFLRIWPLGEAGTL